MDRVLSWGKRILRLVLLCVVLTLIAPIAVVGIWGLVIPRFFSGAVAQGVLPASLNLREAFELVILASVFGLGLTWPTTLASNIKSRFEDRKEVLFYYGLLLTSM